MPSRTMYNPRPFVMSCGEIGRLMTLQAVPIVAGSSIEVHYAGTLTLSELRRRSILDAQVDMLGFFIPFRWTYGSSWNELIEQGVDSNVTLPTYTISNDTHYLGSPSLVGTVPRWLDGYNRIWNRYFRQPSDHTGERALDLFASDNDREQHFGIRCSRLPSIMTGGVHPEVSADDINVPDLPSSAVGSFSLLDLSRQQARLKTEREREFFLQRYADVMTDVWGGSTPSDADQRPMMLQHMMSSMTGHDVDGTADANLGQVTGKSVMSLDFRIPRRYFGEHGVIWIVLLLRWPTVHEAEQSYWLRNPSMTYSEIAGDPRVVASEPPVTHDLTQYATSGFATDAGLVPYGQHYRTVQNSVHRRFDNVNGYPFLTTAFADRDASWYHQPGEYDEVFGTTPLGHWQLYAATSWSISSPVPPGRSSVFAGTH